MVCRCTLQTLWEVPGVWAPFPLTFVRHPDRLAHLQTINSSDLLHTNPHQLGFVGSRGRPLRGTASDMLHVHH